jgi:hypothetical protein
MYEYKRNIEARSRNHFCCGKAASITYSLCVCSLSFPAHKAHGRIILACVASPTVPYFSTFCHKLGLPDFRVGGE